MVNGITYKPLVVDSDRIIGVQMVSNGILLLTVLGVYLPYYNGLSAQNELYSETLDILKSVIDDIGPAPLMIVGDMNAALPSQVEISRRWYRLHPYNKHSYILYDFLRSNELVVANFCSTQGVNYTYYNVVSRSYIDHVFVSRHTGDIVKSCLIISDLP